MRPKLIDDLVMLVSNVSILADLVFGKMGRLFFVTLHTYSLIFYCFCICYDFRHRVI